MKRVSVGVLPNGVRWYTQFDPKSHVSGVGVRIGSIYDPPQLCGMNHLVEHILANYGYENELKCVEYGCGPDEDINIRVDRSSTFYGNSLLLRREYTLDLFSIFASAVRDQEIIAMYNKLHDQYVEAFTTTPNLLSEMIIEAACNGDEDMARLNSYLGRLSRVGPKTLCRVANEYLTAKNCLIVVIKPDENQEPNEKVTIRL